MNLHRNLRRSKKGIGTVFGMVFFLLIVMIVFASFMILLNQNTGLEQTTIQTKQMDLDRYTELSTVSIANPETAVLNHVVYLLCDVLSFFVWVAAVLYAFAFNDGFVEAFFGGLD